MPNPDDELLKRLLAHNPEAREEARRTLVKARSVTGPGSGYNILDGKTGLAAICAYIATIKAGYDDLDLTTAQKASCLEPKLFKRTLETVKLALNAKRAEVPRAKSTSRLRSEASIASNVSLDEQRTVRDSFLPIITKHRLGKQKLVATWMQWMYQDMKKHLEEEMLEASEQDLLVAAYASVAEIVKKPPIPQALCAEYKVSYHKHMDIRVMTKRRCKEITKSIRDEIDKLSRQSRSQAADHRTPSRSSTHPSIAPTNSHRTVSPSKSVIPAPGTSRPLKRAISTRDDEDAVDDTPSKPKRLRVSSPYKTPFTPTADELYRDVIKTPAPAVLQPHYARKGHHGDGYDSEAGDGSGSEVERELRHATTPPGSDGFEQDPMPTRGPSTVKRPLHTPRKHANGAGPSQRTPYAKKPLGGTVSRSSPGSFDMDETGSAMEEEDEEIASESAGVGDELLPPVQRFRPVLLDRQQWTERAPQLTAEWAKASQNMRQWTAKHGQPFESLRA